MLKANAKKQAAMQLVGFVFLDQHLLLPLREKAHRVAKSSERLLK